MKILIDNNLPIVLKKAFPKNTVHVTEVLKNNSTDKNILNYCLKNDIDLIITKDVDFGNLISNSLKVKCILCKVGNVGTHDLVELFIKYKNKIKYFNKSNEKILEVK